MRVRMMAAVLVAVGLSTSLTAVEGVASDDNQFVPPMSGVWSLSAATRFSNAPQSAVPSTCKGFVETGSNPYNPNVTPNVDQIVGDVVNGGPGSNIGCITPQNEPAIAINPTNPNNIVGGANDYRFRHPGGGRNDSSGGYYYSFDAGSQWGNGFAPGLVKGNPDAPGPYDAAGDPALAFSDDGRLYYANIAFNRSSPENGVFVNTSTDGGVTFGPPATVTATADPTLFNDKEWIAVDTAAASPWRGSVYVTWTQLRFSRGGTYIRSPILLARSTDGGQTFSLPVPLSTPRTAYNSWSMPVVGPNGDVHVIFQNWPTLASANGRHMTVRSTDGGATFDRPRVIADVTDFPYDSATGRETLTGQTFRVNSGASLAVDGTTGALYAVWADNRNGTSSLTNGDVLLSRSSDGGRTWSSPQKINTEVGAHDQFFPWVAVGGDGSVHVGFYDRQFVAGGDPADDTHLDYAYVRSLDGGVTFSATQKVTTQASDPNTQFDGLFIGDYTAVAADEAGNAYLSWTDNRGRPGPDGTTPNQDAYMVRIPRAS